MGSPWLKSNWRHTCPGPELFLNTPSRLHPWFKKEDEERKGLKGIQGKGEEQGWGSGGEEVQHERDGRSDLVRCAFVSGICQVVRSIETAEKLFVSVTIQAEHCNKTPLFPNTGLTGQDLLCQDGRQIHQTIFFHFFWSPVGRCLVILWIKMYYLTGEGKKPGHSSTKLE